MQTTQALHRAVDQAQHSIDGVLAKARFWQRFAGVPMNQRQIKFLNRLLDGFEGKLTSSKWAAIAKCSPDTALRDIDELVGNDGLRKSSSGGRSTCYADRCMRTDGVGLDRFSIALIAYPETNAT
jgi:Fic family protein